MSDLVERLRNLAPGMGGRDACLEAADEIERLRGCFQVLVNDEIISADRARELCKMTHEQQRESWRRTHHEATTGEIESLRLDLENVRIERDESAAANRRLRAENMKLLAENALSDAVRIKDLEIQCGVLRAEVAEERTRLEWLERWNFDGTLHWDFGQRIGSLPLRTAIDAAREEKK